MTSFLRQFNRFIKRALCAMRPFQTSNSQDSLKYPRVCFYTHGRNTS